MRLFFLLIVAAAGIVAAGWNLWRGLVAGKFMVAKDEFGPWNIAITKDERPIYYRNIVYFHVIPIVIFAIFAACMIVISK